MEAPETRYAKSGDVHVAYQVFGDGGLDLVFLAELWNSIEALCAFDGPAHAIRGACAIRDGVLVSSTVRDLVAGSGSAFADRGLHTLRGVPEPWHLFTVVDA